MEKSMTEPMAKLLLTLVFSAFAAQAYSRNDHIAPHVYTRHCVACHARMTGGEGETLYTRNDRMVRSEEALRARVDYCRNALDLNWSAAETDSVVRYLNQRFYRFPQREQQGRERGRTKKEREAE